MNMRPERRHILRDHAPESRSTAGVPAPDTESIANTPLFAGFPGFRTKLWLTDERTGEYRGLYDWDGPERAQAYATTLVALLLLVCVPGSVAFHIEPHVGRDDFLRRAAFAHTGTLPPLQWWAPAQRAFE